MPANKKHEKNVKKMSRGAKVSVSTKPNKSPAEKSKKPASTGTATRADHSQDLTAEVKRLSAELESMKTQSRKRPGSPGDAAPVRRDQDKILADRLARLDEKIESLWGRVADLEEHLEGDGGTRTREADFDETPDRDFYEH